MHESDLILTFTSGLGAALVLGYITHRMGLSPIVGYLLAGVIVGPYTPGYSADIELAEQMAEVGVILLMFGVGLQLHLADLLAVRHVAAPGAIFTSLLATLLGLGLQRLCGGSLSTGIVYGLSISVASTVVLTRVLTDHRDLHSRTGHIAMGWLVVEDLLTVITLVLLPALFGSAKTDEPTSSGTMIVVLALVTALAKLGVLVGLIAIFGRRLIPRLLEHVAATRSRELFTLTVLVVALGIAVASAQWFGVSMALGAFLAGMIVGRSEFSLRAATEALPMRDAFAVLFFVSVGMLFDPMRVFDQPGLLLGTCAIVLIGKPVAALSIVLLLGYPLKVGLGVAMALAQIGEFSFILAGVGKELGLLDATAANALVATSILSITINPLLYKGVSPVSRWLLTQSWIGRFVHTAQAESGPAALDVGGGQGEPVASATTSGERAVLAPESHGSSKLNRQRHRAIVVGYGPVGRTLTRLLRENGIEPTVIELNLDTIRHLREHQIPAVYGDADQRDTLKAAGAREAGSLILTASGMAHSAEVIRVARELNPSIQVLARSSYVQELAALRKAGATSAFSGEGEVALSFIEAVLRPLGATPEQIDRERDRFRTDILQESGLVPGAHSAAVAFQPTSTGKPVTSEGVA